MPRAPRLCPHRDCTTLITTGPYCPEHTEHHWPKGTTRTGDARHRQWALDVKKRDRYRCRRCGYQGSPAASDIDADHIIPVAEGGAEYDLENGQALCKPCHRSKSQAEAYEGRARAARRRAAT